MTNLLSSFLDRLVQEEGIAAPEGYQPLPRLVANGRQEGGSSAQNVKKTKLAENLA
jgi:hypothetical protein